jgi:hypothetical protein
VQTGNLSLRERLVREVSKRLAPPQPQRRAQPLLRAGRVAARQRPPPLSTQRLELNRVDLPGRGHQPVGPPLRHDHTGAQRLPQLRDIHLNRLGRGPRGPLTPQLIDQAVNRDHLATVQHQDSQQGPLLRRAERQRLAVPRHLQRPKYPEIHGWPPTAP